MRMIFIDIPVERMKLQRIRRCSSCLVALLHPFHLDLLYYFIMSLCKLCFIDSLLVSIFVILLVLFMLIL